MDMFSPELYFPVFLYTLLVFVIFQYSKIGNVSNRALLWRDNNNMAFMLYVFLFVVFVGLRPISLVFCDTVNYASEYRIMANGGMGADETDNEWLFSNAMYWFASHGIDVKWFFLLVEIFYIVPLVLACKRFSVKNSTILLLFSFTAFSFFSYGVNGIRNGAACSLVILAMTYLQGSTKDKAICAGLCFLAFNIHRSTALPIAAMLFSRKNVNPRYMFYFWGFSIVLSLTIGGMIENFFASFGFDDRMTNYLSALDDDEVIVQQFSQTGFRWDFLLYSVMPIWLGWYLIFKRKIYNSTYMLLLGTYIYSNAFWVMVIRSSFSNRFAYLSWFLYPIVLAYPLLKFSIWPKQGEKTAMILLAHFGFTFVMWLLGKV